MAVTPDGVTYAGPGWSTPPELWPAAVTQRRPNWRKPTMSETRHSPGPWKIGFGAGDQDEYFTVVDANGEAVTDYSVSNHDVAMSHGQMVANARLIAASPTLLAELTETAAWLDDRANVLVQLLADPAGWGRGQAATGKRQAIRQLIDKATTQGA